MNMPTSCRNEAPPGKDLAQAARARAERRPEIVLGVIAGIDPRKLLQFPQGDRFDERRRNELEAHDCWNRRAK